ncbi:hypothetical protein pb186bvf_016034 [Paramecium bursaria]
MINHNSYNHLIPTRITQQSINNSKTQEAVMTEVPIKSLPSS